MTTFAHLVHEQILDMQFVLTVQDEVNCPLLEQMSDGLEVVAVVGIVLLVVVPLNEHFALAVLSEYLYLRIREYDLHKYRRHVCLFQRLPLQCRQEHQYDYQRVRKTALPLTQWEACPYNSKDVPEKRISLFRSHHTDPGNFHQARGRVGSVRIED